MAAPSYSIKVYNVPWSNDYGAVLRPVDEADRERVFAYYLTAAIPYKVNFNIQDALNTEIVLTIPTLPENDLIRLLNANYLIADNGTKKLYFFINSSRQLSGAQIACTCEVDVFQQYVILHDDPESGGYTNIHECLVQRKHADRWSPFKSGNSLEFNVTPSAPVFADMSSISEAVICKGYEFLTPNSASGRPQGNILDAVTQKYKDNVFGWVYVFLNTGISDSKVKLGTEPGIICYSIGQQTPQDTAVNSLVPVQAYCIAAPISKTEMHATDFDGSDVVLDGYGLIDYLTSSQSGQIYGLYISDIPPISVSTFWDTSTPYTGRNEANDETTRVVTVNGRGAILIQNSLPAGYRALMTGYEFPVFVKTDIVNASEAVKNAEPALFRKPYSFYRVSQNGASTDFDYMQNGPANYIVRKGVPSFLSSGGNIRPGGTDAVDSEAILSPRRYKYGAVQVESGPALSIPFMVDQFQQYVANNKNYENQFLVKQLKAAINGVSSSMQTAMTMGFSPQGTAAGATQLVTTASNIYFDARQQQMSWENLRSAPDSANAGDAHALFQLIDKTVFPMVEYFELIPPEKERAFWLYYRFGYGYNRFARPMAPEISHTRARFNFVQATVEEIGGRLSNDAKARIRSAFASGVTFWETRPTKTAQPFDVTELFEYGAENYEVNLV